MQIQRCLTLSADAASDQACRRGYIVFRQDSDSSSYYAKDTIKVLQQEKPDFIGPVWLLNNPDLQSPVDY